MRKRSQRLGSRRILAQNVDPQIFVRGVGEFDFESSVVDESLSNRQGLTGSFMPLSGEQEPLVVRRLHQYTSQRFLSLEVGFVQAPADVPEASERQGWLKTVCHRQQCVQQRSHAQTIALPAPSFEVDDSDASVRQVCDVLQGMLCLCVAVVAQVSEDPDEVDGFSLCARGDAGEHATHAYTGIFRIMIGRVCCP